MTAKILKLATLKSAVGDSFVFKNVFRHFTREEKKFSLFTPVYLVKENPRKVIVILFFWVFVFVLLLSLNTFY